MTKIRDRPSPPQLQLGSVFLCESLYSLPINRRVTSVELR